MIWFCYFLLQDQYQFSFHFILFFWPISAVRFCISDLRYFSVSLNAYLRIFNSVWSVMLVFFCWDALICIYFLSLFFLTVVLNVCDLPFYSPSHSWTGLLIQACPLLYVLQPLFNILYKQCGGGGGGVVGNWLFLGLTFFNSSIIDLHYHISFLVCFLGFLLFPF